MTPKRTGPNQAKANSMAKIYPQNSDGIFNKFTILAAISPKMKNVRIAKINVFLNKSQIKNLSSDILDCA